MVGLLSGHWEGGRFAGVDIKEEREKGQLGRKLADADLQEDMEEGPLDVCCQPECSATLLGAFEDVDHW